MSKPEEFKFDSRVRDRFLRSRALSGADVKKHLDALPDLEGEYELMNDTPQPAVTPTREVSEEPLVFDGIRRLHALSDPHAPLAGAGRGVPPAGLGAREPAGRPAPSSFEASRGPSPALRSALMESEISGVGAGAVSAALGAMAAEARGAAGFAPPVPVVPVVPPSTPDSEPHTPLTLRSEAAPEGLLEENAPGSTAAGSVPAVPPSAPASGAVADWEAPYPDSEDLG
ncbi:MAG TPA: hypothetical protein VJU61_05290 [Polyangiaceae bacterium]|nr:hypothetical protein [Polyangiaceae bacterium]